MKEFCCDHKVSSSRIKVYHFNVKAEQVFLLPLFYDTNTLKTVSDNPYNWAACSPVIGNTFTHFKYQTTEEKRNKLPNCRIPVQHTKGIVYQKEGGANETFPWSIMISSHPRPQQ